MLRWLIVAGFTLLACGDDSTSPGGSGGSGGTGGSGAGTNDGAGGTGAGNGGTNEGGQTADGGAGEGGGQVTMDFVAGGERPVTVRLPQDYDPAVPTPLLILLHGYGASGALQDSYFHMADAADASGLVFAAPDGTKDANGSRFWTATDACCNFAELPVDDSAYLIGLVDEIAGKLNIDPGRVYFAGHSNGGFMSYRLACDHADKITAIASLAGATHNDQADCSASEPVSVLQIHGTADATIAYAGGQNLGNFYPGAQETVQRWVTVNGCDQPGELGEPRDIESSFLGDESSVEVFSGCEAETSVELWTIPGGSHIPSLAADFSQQVIDWLLTHHK